MKDKPHHMADFIKGYAKEETPKSNEILKEFEQEHPESQKKKQIKAKKRKKREAVIHEPDTPYEENIKMNKRVPQIRERSHKTTI